LGAVADHGYLLVALITIIFYIMILKYPEHFSLWVLTICVFVSVYIYLATINGITQATVWQLKPERGREKLEEDMLEAEKIEEESNQADRASDSKPNPKINEIASKVVQLLGNEKLYQEPELTLQDLADKLQAPSYQVSQAINEGMKKNFYDLINSYRVEEAKRLLLIPGNRNYTILSVGFEAGSIPKQLSILSSKNSRVLTPTDYRDQHKQPAN
jgi:YesN/AraC family two-component response regulator